MTAETFERSPLAGREDDLARIVAREIPFPTQISVRSRAPEELGLPTVPNTWAPIDIRDALWLGPDEWLVVGRPGTALSFHRGGYARYGLRDGTVEGLETADSVVDVSAARAVLELTSEDRHETLSKGCGLDLHPRSWRDGMCAQTLLARVPVILQERDGATRVFLRPSFAGYLVDWLLDAAGVPA